MRHPEPLQGLAFEESLKVAAQRRPPAGWRRLPAGSGPARGRRPNRRRQRCTRPTGCSGGGQSRARRRAPRQARAREHLGRRGAARHRSRGRSDPPPPDRPASAVAMPLRRSGYGSRAAPRRHAPAGTRTAEAEPPGRGAKGCRPRSSHEGGCVCGDLAAGASPTTSTRGPRGPDDPERRSRLLETRFLHPVPDAERSHDVAGALPALQNQRTIGRQDPATRPSTKRPPPRSTS